MPTHDWTPRNSAFEIDYKKYHVSTVASVCAISLDGPELIQNYPKSINGAKYCLFLRALRAKHPDRKILIFQDQLTVHHCKEVKPVYEELMIKVRENVAYSPNYNPAEGAISVCKLSIKRERFRASVLNKPIDVESEIEKSFMKIEKKVCVNFIAKCN